MVLARVNGHHDSSSLSDNLVLQIENQHALAVTRGVTQTGFA